MMKDNKFREYSFSKVISSGSHAPIGSIRAELTSIRCLFLSISAFYLMTWGDLWTRLTLHDLQASPPSNTEISTLQIQKQISSLDRLIEKSQPLKYFDVVQPYTDSDTATFKHCIITHVSHEKAVELTKHPHFLKRWVDVATTPFMDDSNTFRCMSVKWRQHHII